MPPSGFNQKAINGLLEFTLAIYEQTLAEHKEGSQKELLLNKTKELASKVFPELNQKALKGISSFVTECFSDLVKEIDVGKDKQGRIVMDHQAMQKEIIQIKDYLEKFTI